LPSRIDRRNVSVDEPETLQIMVRDNKLFVTDWETDDAEIVSFFQNKPSEDRSKAFDRAVKVGVVASSIVGTAERIDFIQREFAGLEGRFNDVLNSTIEELEKRFNKVFGERGTFPKALDDTFGEKGQIVRQIFDPSREGTPLYQLRVELTRQLSDLKTALVVDKAELKIEVKTTRKGLRFQDEIGGILDELVRQRKGDQVERLTDTPGRVTRSKKGDFIIRMAEKPDLPIVVEVKDEEMSLPAIQRELTEAMENRGAAYAVFIAKDVSRLPAPVGWFNEYQGERLVCAVGDSDSQQLRGELVSVAIAWARIRVLQRVERESVDSTQVRDAVGKAKVAIERLKEVLTQCGNLETTTGKIRVLCREITLEITDQLDAIGRAITA